MTIQIPVVQEGTYNERVTLNTTGLVYDNYWFQINDGPSAPQGYYRWVKGAWQQAGDAAVRQVFQSPFYIYNGQLVVRRDDADAVLEAVSGLGLQYFAAGLLLSRDNLQRIRQWFISMTANAAADLAISRFDDSDNFLDIPLSISRATGVVTLNKALYLNEALVIGSEITPPQITADQNNYSPTDFSTATVIRISSDIARNITGLAAYTAGVKILFNAGAFAITLKNASGLSVAANRFALKADLAIASMGSAILRYDPTLTSWVCLATY